MEKQYIIIRENLRDSLISDFFSFAFLFALLAANKYFFGDHLSIAIMITFIVFVRAYRRAGKIRKSFDTLEETKFYINSLKQ